MDTNQLWKTLMGGTLSQQAPDLDNLRYQSFEEAMSFLHPTIEPLSEGVHEGDLTLAIERLLPRQCTQTFFNAAFQEPDPDGDPLGGWEAEFWSRLLENLAHRWGRYSFPYSQRMVEAWLSLLFHIALHMHQGGQSIYQAPDYFGPEFEYQRNLTFRARLERIAEYLGRHKWLVIDILEQRLTQVFVASPDKWVELRKVWIRSQPLPDVENSEGRQTNPLMQSDSQPSSSVSLPPNGAENEKMGSDSEQSVEQSE